ncbi:hypothetical protein FNU76_06735 [Chitinimonas arctica]|uniref:Uncharacterized protein n=1 Tax=Chitinimonas arctica TaxID=2594795 RepID=A0A516SD35_9NEIS|nr:hypothetical protein [Chitinimonas arctica]QDQ26069.1 hypothetical protein FNU76_06735 [Chitinimonas arctica]
MPFFILFALGSAMSATSAMASAQRCRQTPCAQAAASGIDCAPARAAIRLGTAKPPFQSDNKN